MRKKILYILAVGVIIAGAAAGAVMLVKGVSLQPEPARIPVVVEFVNADDLEEADVVSMIDSNNNVVGIVATDRGHETTIVPGDDYYIGSWVLQDGIVVTVPGDEDGFTVTVDYETGTMTVEGLGE